jgi:phosphopantetheine adenylyltransferase
MATCAQKQTWLTAAETALHNLQIGGAVEVLRHGEKSLTYTAANVGELRKYVQLLTDQVNACNGASTLRRRIFGVIPQG